MNIITQAQAKEQGLSRFFTGNPCIHGHIAERLTCNSTCCDCMGRIAKNSFYRQGNPEVKRAQSRAYRKDNIVKVLVQEAKGRAKRKGYPHSITDLDLILPERCPILGIELLVGNEHPGDNHPSLDRIVPELGYVKGNVIIVSQRANRIKNDSTIEELEIILNFYKGLIK